MYKVLKRLYILLTFNHFFVMLMLPYLDIFIFCFRDKINNVCGLLSGPPDRGKLHTTYLSKYVSHSSTFLPSF